MKTIVSTVLIILALVLSLNAQNNNPERNQKIHERITEAKLRKIKLALKLDETTFEKFRPIYMKYEKEIMDIDFRKSNRLMKANADSISDEEAKQLIVSRMENAKKMIAVREKYYKEYSSVLNQQQIIKLYQTENEIRKKVAAEIKRRKLNKKNGKSMLDN